MHRKLIASLLALAAAQLIAGCVNPSVVAYSRGRMYETSNRYKEAIEEYTSAIHFEPKHPYAHYDRGYCYYKLDKLDLALKDFASAIELDPKNANAYYWRGWCLSANSKDYAQAIKDYDKTIELNPKKSDAYFQRGYCRYYSSGSVESALADYSKAISLEPEDADYYYYRALLYRDQSRYADMYRDLLQTIAIKPHFAKGYVQLAWAAYLNSKFPEVVSNAESALEVTKWRLDTAGEMVLLSNIANRKLRKTEQARMVLTKGLSRCKRVWPYPLLEYYDGKINRRAIFRMAGNDDNKLRQANVFVGLDELVKGNNQEATEYFDQVIFDGDQYVVEYMVAKLELDSLKAKGKGKHS